MARRREGRKDRAYRRYSVRGVTGSLRTAVPLHILDVSASGMQVATSAHLTVGRSYRFNLSDGSTQLEVSGEVRWCVLNVTRKVDDDERCTTYTAGVAFDQDSVERVAGLLRMVEPSIEVELDPGLSGSFQVSDSTSAVAELDFDFTVRRMSLSGMLIEADFAPLLETVFVLILDLRGDVLEATGRVAYTRAVPDDRTRTEIGVEFLGMSDDDRSRLRRIIEEAFSTRDPALE